MHHRPAEGSAYTGGDRDHAVATAAVPRRVDDDVGRRKAVDELLADPEDSEVVHVELPI